MFKVSCKVAYVDMSTFFHKVTMSHYYKDHVSMEVMCNTESPGKYEDSLVI